MKDTNSCKYGFFDPENREYVIQSPFTPSPWINYLGCVGDLDAFISNRAGGTAWYKQPHTGRLTKYQFTALPEDTPGFYLYIKEGGALWNPSFQPTGTPLDHYECRHGLYYTRFHSSKNSLCADIRYFIPMEDPVLLWDVTFTNTGKTGKTFSVFPYLDFSMRDVLKDVLYYHFCGNQMTGSYDAEENALALDYFAFEANHPGFTMFNASRKFTAFDMQRKVFIGRCRTEANPEALISGKLSNSEAAGGGFPICGTFQLDFTLAPGASERVIIKLAVSPRKEDAAALLRKYSDPAVVDQASVQFKKWWDCILAKNHVNTPDAGLNEMLNVWLPKNIKAAMRCGRSISQRHTGTGTSNCFRDSMQDIMNGSLFFPEETKQKIRILLRSIRKNGQITLSINPDTFRCPNPEYIRCDAIVWGIFTISKYIAETGDTDFLQEEITDYDGGKASVLDLLLRAMHFTGENTGSHGLPKLFNCDWNDSLVIVSAIRKDGESIMVAMQYIAAAKRLIGMMGDRPQEKTFLQKRIAEFSKLLDGPDVWDGAWYRRLLFPTDCMGSAKNEEAQLFLNTQTWAALAETLDPEHVRKAMDCVHQRLNTPYGLQLFLPPFTRLMDGTRYCGNAPGAGENSGLFYHANTWAVIAEAVCGNADHAWEYLMHIMPNCRAEENADLYEREPYAFASWVYGPASANYGKASLSHLTGGASWIYYTASEYLLGIRPEPGRLLIAPCIPREWDGYSVDREIAGAFYHIEVKNPRHKSGPAVRLTVNGVSAEGSYVPNAPRGSRVNILAELV